MGSNKRGNNYPVFTTAELTTVGLGFVLYIYPRQYWPLGTRRFTNENKSPLTFHTPLDVDSNGYFEFRVGTIFRLVKINDNFDALVNTPTSTPYTNPFPLVEVAIGDNESNYVSPSGHITSFISWLNIRQRACTPFVDTTVQLLSVDVAVLPHIGNTGTPKDFNFTVRCPHNAARYGYYVESVHGYEDEAQGVIKIDPASTAKGIGLQITTRKGGVDPIYFDNNSLLPNYQPIKFGSLR